MSHPAQETVASSDICDEMAKAIFDCLCPGLRYTEEDARHYRHAAEVALSRLRAPPQEKDAAVDFGFASFSDGRFELIVRNRKTWEETTLKGTLEPGQFELADRILPTCVYVVGIPAAQMTPSEPAREALVTEAAGRIIDIMSGEKLDWRLRIDASDFLESADWQCALSYARAALAHSAPAAQRNEPVAWRYRYRAYRGSRADEWATEVSIDPPDFSVSDLTPLYAALQASFPAGAANAWQSVETAPKDVEVLMCWHVEWPAPAWEYASGLWGSTRGGWSHGQATHWMPLPQPPEAQP